MPRSFRANPPIRKPDCTVPFCVTSSLRSAVRLTIIPPSLYGRAKRSFFARVARRTASLQGGTVNSAPLVGTALAFMTAIVPTPQDQADIVTSLKLPD